MADLPQLLQRVEVRARPTRFGNQEIDFRSKGHVRADGAAVLGVTGECDR
jgi:hypothetical protein